MKNKFLVLLIISVISLFLSSFVVSALLPNYPAYWDTLENKNVNEDTKGTVLIYQNIKSKCHDPDDPIRIFNIASTHNHYKLSISKNNLYLTDLEPNYDKTERITLNCNGVYGYFNLITTTTNDAPIANNIISNTNEDTEKIITLNYNEVDTNDKAESCNIFNILGGTLTKSCSCNNGICTAGLTPLANSVADITANYQVNDGELDSNTATITITVNPIDDSAVWQTLEDKTINEDSPYTIIYQNIKSKCTDIDSPINMQLTSTHNNYDLSFSGNDLVINNLKQNYNGAETVNLDCNGIPNSFVLNVNPINDAPTIDSYNPIQDQITIQEGNSQEFSLQASDIDNDDLTIKWYVNDIEVGIGDSYTFNTDYSSSDNSPYRVKVVVTDENEYIPHNWILTVLNTNRAPISYNINNIITQEDIPVKINLNCEDPDNDILSYEIVNDVTHGSIIINNNIATYTPEQDYNGQDSFSYRCSDGKDFSNNAIVSININSINDSAVWQTLSNKAIPEDSADNTIVYPDLLLQCTDIDSPINMQLTSTHNNYDLSFSGNDLVINNLKQNYNGAETVNLDCNGIPNSFVLNVNPINQAPIVSDIPSQTIDVGFSFTTFDLDGYLTELDGDNIIWSHAGETDLTVNIDINNVVTITAPSRWAGSETITFTATDNNSEALFDSDDATFTIIPLPINNPPTITSTPTTNAMANQEYVYDVNAIDSEGDTITYSLTKKPTGMTINSNTGLIQWTPKNKGNYEVIVKISDDKNNYVTQAFTINVDALYSKKHLFSIGSVSLPSNVYNNGDTIDGFILLRNLGHLKEKEISGKVSIPNLGIVEQIPQTTLGVYDNKWVPFEINLPDNIQEGEYLIKIELKNSKYTATKFSTFIIENK